MAWQPEEPADNDEGDVWASLRSRLISVGTVRSMSRPLRVLTAAAVALLGVYVCLILIGRLPFEKPVRFPSGLLKAGGGVAEIEARPSVILFGATLMVAAWSLTLVAAAHSRKPWLPVLVALGYLAYGNELLAVEVGSFATGLGWAAMAGVGLVLLLAARGDRRALRAGRPDLTHPVGFQRSTAVCLALLVAAVHVIVVADVGLQTFAGHLFGSVKNVAFMILAPALLFAGVDFAEIAEVVGTVGSRRLQRGRGRVAIAVLVLVASAGVVVGVHQLGWAIPISLALCVVLGLYLLHVIRRSGMGTAPDPPALGLVVAVALVVYLFGPFLQDAGGHNALLALTVPAVAAIFYGFPASLMAERGHIPIPGYLYLLVAGVFSVFLVATGSALRALGEGAELAQVVVAAPAVVGALTLAVLVWIWASGLPAPWRPQLVRTLLFANLAVALLAAFVGLLWLADEVGPGLSGWQAVLILVGLTWDIATAGHVFGGEGRVLPRHARIPLYFGFIVAIAAAVLLVSPVGGLAGEAVDEAPFSSDEWALVGIVVLGLPLVLSAAIQGFRRSLVGYPSPGRNPLERLGDRLNRRPVSFAWKPVRVVAIVALWFGALVAVIGPFTVPGGIPEDWESLTAARGEFRIYAPPTWVDSRRLGWALFAYDGDSPDGLPTQVVVTKADAPAGDTPEALLARGLESVQDDGVVSAVETAAVSLPVGPGWQATAIVTPEGAEPLALTVYAFIRRSQDYLVYFWVQSDAAAGTPPLFADMARSLRFL